MPSATKGSYKPVNKDASAEKPPPYDTPRGFGARHSQALILFISLSVVFCLRAQLSVTMVAITNIPKSYQSNCINSDRDCIEANNSESSGVNDGHLKTDLNSTVEYDPESSNSIGLMNATYGGCFSNKTLDEYYEEKGKWNVYRTYAWSKPIQEIIMYSFFLGYLTMMIPMAMAAQRFGGKVPIMVALFVNGVVSTLTPWMPLLGGWVAMSACRLVQGMTQSSIFPSMHTMLGQWAPISERGRLSTYIYTGSQFGTVFIFQVSGLLCGNPTFGWPSAFWLCGALSFISLGLLAWYGAATPADHRTITPEELFYITGSGTGDSSKRRKTPWRAIVTCKAVWGAVITHCGSAVGYLFIFTEIPLYMSKILNVDIKRNGFYSSLPYVAMYIMALCFGVMSDYLANRRYMTLVNIRRLSNTIGMAASAGFLIAFSFTNNTVFAVALLILCLAAHAGVHVGFMINQIDLAPNFAGPIMSLGNMLGSVSALGVPLLVSNIVTDVTDQKQWRTVIISVAVIQIATNLVYVTFANADVQSWNFAGDEERTDGRDEEMKIFTQKEITLKEKE